MVGNTNNMKLYANQNQVKTKTKTKPLIYNTVFTNDLIIMLH